MVTSTDLPALGDARCGALRVALAVLLLFAPPAGAATLYLVRRGWHVDVGVAAASLHPPLARIVADFPQAHFMFFGFGDRHYLESKHHGSSSMLAALWPGQGLILATGLSATPTQAFGSAQVLRLEVSNAGLLAAEAAIWRSLRQRESEMLERIAQPGPYQGSGYYASSLRYSARYTCNTWAIEVLHAGGLPVHSGGVVFAGQVWRQARRLAAGEPDAPAAASLAISP